MEWPNWQSGALKFHIFGCSSVACLGAVIKLAGEAFDLHTHSLSECRSRGAGRRQMQRFSSITSMLCHQCVRPFTFDCCVKGGGGGWSVCLYAACSFLCRGASASRDGSAHAFQMSISERGAQRRKWPRVTLSSDLHPFTDDMLHCAAATPTPAPKSPPRAGSMANLRISRR
jgi:hypothetical protein